MSYASIRAVLLALVLGSTAAASFAQQAVGRVLLSSGDVSALRNGQPVRLQFNSPIEFRDVLRTGPASSLQIRFVDEGLLSIRENSEFAIEEYQFGRTEAEQRSLFRLIKGGFRAVTGIIGRVNHDNYKVRAETATVGIRGTDFAVRDCRGDCGAGVRDGLYGTVLGMSSGTNQITVNNNAGEAVFGINQHFHVPDANTRPQPLLQPPTFVAVKPQGKAQAAQEGGSGTGNEQAGGSSGAQGESRPGAISETTASFTPIIAATQPFQATVTAAPTFLPPANGFAVSFPGRSLNNLFGDFFFDSDFISGSFNEQNQLTSFAADFTGHFPGAPVFNGSLAGGSITDTGSLTLNNGQVFTWGRWTGNTSVGLVSFDSASGTYKTVQTTGVPVLFGTATGLAGSSVVGTLGGTATYSYLGGPSPVDFGGNVGSITSSTATIDFTHLSAKLQMGISFPSVIASGVNTGSAVFNVTGTAVNPFSSGFGSSCVGCGEFVGSLFGSCSGGGCASTSTFGSFDLGLSGANGYEFAAATGLLQSGGTKAGDVAFLNAYTATSFTSGPAPVGPLWGEIAWSHPSFAPGSTWTIGTFDTAFNASHQPTAFNNSFCTAPSNCLISAALTGSIVDAQGTTLVDGGIMNWGRWNAAQIQDRFSGSLQNYAPPTGVPFVVGSTNNFTFPTGSFVYSLAGGPSVVNTSGVVGSALTQGAFNISFGSNMTVSVATPLQFSVGGGNFSLNSLSFVNSASCPGGVCTSALTSIPSMFFNATCSGACTSVSSVNATGIFFGSQAGGLGVAGNVFSNAPTVTFAGAFKR